MVPTAYDPVTLNHWLWFKYRCHECAPAEFQHLFENIIKRARPEFIQIRSYGNIGDRKCDGLFHAEGTVFQVYSPDELKQADVQAKIRADCDGAVKHWKATLKKWVFVYNARHGLPPDIPRTLDEQRQAHPTLTIDHLSSDALWELARGLSLQQRAEVLGAPAGYEYLFFAPAATGKDVDQAVEEGRLVLVQDLMSPINLRDVAKALAPARSFGAPLWVRPEVGMPPWGAAAAEQAAILEEALRHSRDVLPRFTVFSLAPISLAMHLGFVLSDRVEVACHQFDRERKTWQWPDDAADADLDIQVKGVPNKKVHKTGDVVIRVSLSATIAPEETRAVATAIVEIDVLVQKPDVMWLRSPAQLGALATRFRDILRGIRDHMPGCRRIHLFYVGPTGGAVVIGQQINPRMNPPVETYEYSRQWNPRYRQALTLQEPRSEPDGRMAAGVQQAPGAASGDGNGFVGAPARRAGPGSTSQTEITTPATGSGAQAVIQFVAGDRGGGPRAQLQIPREEKAIRDAVALGRHRDSFAFAPPVWAASIDNLILCHRHRPAVMHFVGHGEERRMVLVRDRDPLVELMLLDTRQAETLFGNFPAKVRLVMFNTCQSIELARHLAGKGVVDLAVGVEGLIPDDHAIRFAATFYRQLAEGLPVQAAFALGGLQVSDLGATARPQLFHAAGVDPAAVVFTGGVGSAPARNYPVGDGGQLEH